MSTSVPTFEFRFHAAEEQLEEIYPDIAEEVALPLDPVESSDATPIAPPRSPKPSQSSKCSSGPKMPRSLHSPVNSSPEPSPLKEVLKPGILSKRSTSMETGIGESASAGPASSDTWRILHELRGKITRTMEDKLTEIKNDRMARSENRKNRLAANAGKKDEASFSDSEDASSSENSNLMNPVSNSNSATQLSGVSSLSSTPTGTGTAGSSRSRKLSRTDDEAGVNSRPTTPSIPEKSGSCKAIRAGSVPTLVAESPTLDIPPKRSLSLRSQIKPKFCELRNRRKKAESRSNPSISSSMFLGDGEESDEDDATDAVEEGVEAREEDWPDTTVTPSVPLGTMLSALNESPPPPPAPPSLTIKQKVWLHRYVVLVITLLWFMIVLPTVPVLLFVLLGALVVKLVQEEMKIFSTPSPSVASINMGYTPFTYPNYNEMPISKVPAAAEVVPAPCFEGWMNDFAGKYDTNSYHISLTESVFVRLEGSMLTLKYTRVKIPKRAMWNEPASRKVTFTHVRYFNIRGCQVKLLPEGIARRRQWSKKYPICIVLNSGSAIATPDETADLEVDEIRPPPEEEKETEKEKSKEESPPIRKVTTSAKYAKSSTESLELTILRSDDSIGDLSKEIKETTSTSKPRLATSSSKEGNSDLSGAEAEDDESFSIINSDASNCLYLFARADREKEEWFRRFAEAVRPQGSRSYVRASGRDVNPEPVAIDDAIPLTPSLAVATLTEYLRYMQCFQLENKPYLIRPPKTSIVEKEAKKRDKDKEKEKDKEKHKEKDSEKERDKEFEAMVTASEEKGTPMAWLNALVGRVCFDILRSAQWKKRLHQRLQKKLSTLKLPYFVEDLTVTELDLGDTVPLIHRTSQPTMDMRGLWVEMDLTYQGGFRMTIESKLNLMKLKKNVSIDAAAALLSSDLPPMADSPVGMAPTTGPTATAASSRSPVFDSDLDDSAESSSDDDHSIQTDDGSQRGPGANPGKTTGKKFLRMVDRIAASKYFQQATEMKYIKKAMEGVSNTRIMLSVELKGLVGTLALNLPPPPSDRLWYGFHGNPKLWLTARPTLGDRQVNFNQISNWIEQKLCQEFQKVLVLPNMDDLVIPVMTSHLPV